MHLGCFSTMSLEESTSEGRKGSTSSTSSSSSTTASSKVQPQHPKSAAPHSQSIPISFVGRRLVLSSLILLPATFDMTGNKMYNCIFYTPEFHWQPLFRSSLCTLSGRSATQGRPLPMLLWQETATGSYYHTVFFVSSNWQETTTLSPLCLFFVSPT